MKKRLRMLFLVVIVAFLGLTCWTRLTPREPTFHGKPLAFWLDRYRFSLTSGGEAEATTLQEDATRAVRQIGTNAIPHLLGMLRERDTGVRIKLIGLLRKQRLINIPDKPAWVRNGEAACGFEILGADAKEAVPALVSVFEQQISLYSQCSAADALAGIGPAASGATPALLRGATNSNAAVRLRVVNAVRHIHPAAALVVPELIGCLSDPSGSVRSITAQCLGDYGTAARQATPRLVQLLQDKEKAVREAPDQALKKIEPTETRKNI